MGRKPCCEKEGMNRGAWTSQEDQTLSIYIQSYGDGKWNSLPIRAGLKRCGKSCRLRWLNYLRPDIKRGNITPDEEDLIVRLHKLLGNRWSLIAGRLPGRTDNEIKNYWNTNLSKKLETEAANSISKLNPKKMMMKKTTIEAINLPIKTTAYKFSNNFKLKDHHHHNDAGQLIMKSPSEQTSPDNYLTNYNMDELRETDFGEGFFFTTGVEELKETDFGDDFNFLNHLLDSETGWMGDL